MKRFFLASCCLLTLLVGLHYRDKITAQTTVDKKSVKKKAVKKGDVYTMLNGIWTIESSPPRDVAEFTNDFLPPGTRLELKIEGPTRLAVEEGLSDELEGKFILIPPFSQGICTTPLGESNGYGSHVCDKGRITDPNDPASNYAEFSFERWDQQPDPEELGNIFFIEQGAKRGAQFVIISLRYKGISWRLWVRDRDTLVGKCVATLPSKQLERVIQIWRRVKTP
jgi:hypothetical protein